MDNQAVQEQYADLAREIHLENMEIQELQNEIIEKREALEQKEKELAKLDRIIDATCHLQEDLELC